MQNTSNLTNDSLLYKFIEPEVIRTSMSADDKAGLQSLYGTLTSNEIAMKAEMQSFADKANAYCTLPCVTPDKETNQKYALNGDEQQAIQIYWQEVKDQGKDNPDFYRFIENELKILIQMRRKFIDASL